MKIFYSFLVMLSVVILFLLPITPGIYDFRTDVKEDTFRYETGGAETTANVTLIKPVYDDDTSTISILSGESTDVPVVVEYHTTTRVLDMSGLVVSTNRTLYVSYDYDALSASGALSTFMDRLGWIWMLCVIVFAPAALASMWINWRNK